MGWRSRGGEAEAVSLGKPLQVRPRIGIRRGSVAASPIASPIASASPIAASLVSPSSTTTAQAQQILDAQMSNLLASGDPNFIKANVTNFAIAAMTAISAVGPAIPPSLQQNVNQAVATIANYNLTGAASDTAVMVTLGSYLYNTMQQILYSIGAAAPSGIPGNLSLAIFNWFRSYNIVGCSNDLSAPTTVLQTAMVMSPGVVNLSGYTQGSYDSATATALQGLLGSATQVPTPCVGAAPAASPGPVVAPTATTSPSTTVTTPEVTPAAATEASSATTPWIVGGAVIVGVTILWLVLQKK